MKFKNTKKSLPKEKKKIKSPSNPRTITEHFKFSLPKINSKTLIKLYGGTLRYFVLFIFIVAAIVVGYDFWENLQIKQNVDIKREILIKDLNFWKDFIAKNQNYRDAYFQASMLEYQLGNMSNAKTYLEKGLILDPNSKEGKRLENFLVNK